MSKDATAISFIKERLKYKATRQYVGNLSGHGLSRLWHIINESEMMGRRHGLYCGTITINILHDAFLREMSYNPVRFKKSSDLSTTAVKICNSVQDILVRFSKLWPNGINGCVYIIDVADSEFTLLRDIRDCFMAIARQNMSDFRQAEYRDEIVARFASDMGVAMDDNIRMLLRNMADRSSTRRKTRREIADTTLRMGQLESQMNLHRDSDRAICLEMQAEHEALTHHLNMLRRGGGEKNKEPKSASQTIFVECDDAAEREEELLRSLTPEHNIDDIFREYIEKVLGHQR